MKTEQEVRARFDKIDKLETEAYEQMLKGADKEKFRVFSKRCKDEMDTLLWVLQ